MAHGFKKIKEFKINLKDKDTGYGKDINIKQYRLPNGVVENFYTTADSDSVQIFPVTSTGDVYLVRQWRPGIEKEQLELPGGGLNDGENPDEAAYRELKEETGLEAGELIPLSVFPYSPYSSGTKHSYLALDCKPTNELDLDPNEFLKVEVLKLDKVKELIKKGKIRGFDVVYMGLDKIKELSQ